MSAFSLWLPCFFLFFVGLTRARKNLELSYYTNPTIPGTYETPSNYLRMLPEELLDWEEKPGSESRKANLQKLRKETQELIREKKQEEEEQKETRKPERKGRHPKYGSVLRRTDVAPLLPVLCFCSGAGSVPDSFR